MARQPRRQADPYVYALTALGRRELTRAQLSDRLVRRGYDPPTIERVLVRLRDEGALDDRRAAAAAARTAVEVKRHGRWRVQRELDRLGVDREIAADVVQQAFETINETQLIERALSARLRGPIPDRKQFDRLYRYLIRQGFPSDQALLALRRHAVDVIDE